MTNNNNNNNDSLVSGEKDYNSLTLGKVLSIQSSVVHGFVGNKCSAFALQNFGHITDILNTVQFSNHTGYEKFGGGVTTLVEIQNIWQNLKQNNLDDYSFLLSGYIRGVENLKEIVKIFQDIQAKNKNVIWVCDPVMGDDGKLYVPQDLVSIYRNEVIPNADIILPNQTEVEFLTDQKITSLKSAFSSIDILHQQGPHTVIATSIDLEKPNFIICLISTFQNCDPLSKKPRSERTGKPVRYLCKLPALAQQFSGTGDLFSALVLAWVARSHSIKDAVERTLNSIRSCLLRTIASNSRELRLIDSRNDLLTPSKELFLEEYKDE